MKTVGIAYSSAKGAFELGHNYGSFAPITPFGTAVALLLLSTWFHNQIKGRRSGFLVPCAALSFWANFFDFDYSALAATNCCNSPLSNISIMMSDPPTNSPLT